MSEQGWWHLALCPTCQMNVPFAVEEKRDEWAARHETTGHQVLRVKEAK